MTQVPPSSGTGSVLPPGTLPKINLAEVLDDPTVLTVTIVSFSNADGMDMVKVEYPDVFFKHHQASTVEQLLGPVTNQLKGRYGVTTFVFDSIPDLLLPGQTINLKEVAYGT